MEQSDKNSFSSMSDHNAGSEQPAEAREQQTGSYPAKRLMGGTFSSISDAELMLATLGSEAADYEETP